MASSPLPAPPHRSDGKEEIPAPPASRPPVCGGDGRSSGVQDPRGGRSEREEPAPAASAAAAIMVADVGGKDAVERVLGPQVVATNHGGADAEQGEDADPGLDHVQEEEGDDSGNRNLEQFDADPGLDHVQEEEGDDSGSLNLEQFDADPGLDHVQEEEGDDSGNLNLEQFDDDPGLDHVQEEEGDDSGNLNLEQFVDAEDDEEEDADKELVEASIGELEPEEADDDADLEPEEADDEEEEEDEGARRFAFLTAAIALSLGAIGMARVDLAVESNHAVQDPAIPDSTPHLVPHLVCDATARTACYPRGGTSTAAPLPSAEFNPLSTMHIMPQSTPRQEFPTAPHYALMEEAMGWVKLLPRSGTAVTMIEDTSHYRWIPPWAFYLVALALVLALVIFLRAVI
ncbi:hypothetical protein ACP70R_032596 [Stipagrostis hirtigluma subsp. patula]